MRKEGGRLTKNLYNIYSEVCSKMDKKEREAALFNVLKVPNDDVKIAVVSCLFYVPINQFNKSEY